MEKHRAHVILLIIATTLQAVHPQDHGQDGNPHVDIEPSQAPSMDPMQHGMHSPEHKTTVATPTEDPMHHGQGDPQTNITHSESTGHDGGPMSPPSHMPHDNMTSQGSHNTTSDGSLDHSGHGDVGMQETPTGDHGQTNITHSESTDHGDHGLPPSHTPQDNMTSHDGHDIASDGSMDHSDHEDEGMTDQEDHSDHGGGDAGGHYGFFHLTTNTILLFEGWKTSTWQEILGACFAFGIASVLYEGLKAMRQALLVKSRPNSGFMTKDLSIGQRMCNCAHFLQSLLHIVQVVYAYMLMLAFMTFNGWICMAIAVGSGIGYFFFGFDRTKVVDANEHCL